MPYHPLSTHGLLPYYQPYSLIRRGPQRRGPLITQATLRTATPQLAQSTMSPIPANLLPLQAKGLVFDCDGTLLDTMGTHYAAWQHSCAKYGLRLSAQEMVALAGKPTHEIFDILCAKDNVVADKEAFFRTKSQFYLDNAVEVKIIDSVLQIAQEGKARGLPMAVASGGTKDHVVKGLQAAGIYDMFDAVVTAEDVKHGKPAPDVFLLAAKLIGVEPQHCVGYEDAVLGMQSIQNAGFLAAVDVTVLPGYPHLTDN